MEGLLRRTQNAMESDNRNQQTNEDLTDAKLTNHRKPVLLYSADTRALCAMLAEFPKKFLASRKRIGLFRKLRVIPEGAARQVTLGVVIGE